MNDRMMKQFGILMLFMVTISCAFKLFFPAKTISSPDVQIEKVAAVRLERPTQFYSRASVTPSHKTTPSHEDAEQITIPSTNEVDVLDWLRNWARRDPEAALIWGERQPEGTNRNEILSDACFQIGQTDPMRAVTLAERLKLSSDAVLENLARQWAAKDLTAAYNWMITQPENDYRDAFATGMAFELAQKEPMDAARFVIQEISSGSVQNEAVMMVLHQWALTDLSGATAWVQQFPEGELQNRALNELSGIARYRQSLSQSK